ncbi:MAG: hypothetical protein ACI8W1_001863 [Candidatus Azotimanducaceae bacterium]|jgi:hypothetical protein
MADKYQGHSLHSRRSIGGPSDIGRWRTTTDPAVLVSFPAGHMVDPNGELNREMQSAVDGVVK